MTLQWTGTRAEGGLPIIIDSELAMHSDCCCNPGPCVECQDKVNGAIVTLSGVTQDPPVIGPADPDCDCGPINGTYNIPWDSSSPATACRSSEVFDYDGPQGPGSDCDDTTGNASFRLIVTAGYSIDCVGGLIELTGWVDISTAFGIQIIFISGTCLTGETCPVATCKGLSCTAINPDVNGGICIPAGPGRVEGEMIITLY